MNLNLDTALLWAILAAVAAAAIAWGKTQADMAQMKRELPSIRRMELQLTKLSTLMEIKFGVRLTDDREEDSRI